MAKVLLTMACGSYPELNGCSSMDLYASRLTHNQDIFSFGSYYPALPIYLIGQNLSAPTVVLESPTFEVFTKEVKKGYDYIGINFNAIFFDKLYQCHLEEFGQPSATARIQAAAYFVYATCAKLGKLLLRRIAQPKPRRFYYNGAP